jgi:plasmid stabilization system protein ParE
MNIKHIQILSDAENDLYDGRDFYDQQGEKLGNYFWDSLLSDIESLVIFAGIHLKEFGYYRMLSRRFPYAIYYDISSNVASVVAVLPMRRDPVWVSEKMVGRN